MDLVMTGINKMDVLQRPWLEELSRISIAGCGVFIYLVVLSSF
jgi:hypothetical protein